MTGLLEGSLVSKIITSPLENYDAGETSTHSSVNTEIFEEMKNKVASLEEKNIMAEMSMMEKENRIKNLEGQLNEKEKENNNLILQYEKLLQRNQELEKQVTILRNYAEKDSLPIGFEECLEIQPYFQTSDKGKDKGKEKVEEESDDDFISSLCNRVKMNKRIAIKSKPKDDPKKIFIQLIHLHKYNISNLLKNYNSYLQQTRKKMKDSYQGMVGSEDTSLVEFFISNVNKL